MSAHTPGPWSVEDPFGPETLSIVPAGRPTYEWVFIASCTYDDQHERPPTISEVERNANAKLIASAPDLIDALHGLIGLVQLIIPTLAEPQRSAVADNHRLVAARAAIAKATGA
ncbi:MAG TPA: hypothetical protein VGH29_07205 [Candidatus Binataceae bacterium]|jgi:hypothetical protein